MTRYLTIHVRAYEGRYHGDGDELPSPFRLFQALVAGAGISGPLDDQTKKALTWLEELPGAPIIASPRLVHGQAVTMFMPNNDLDKFGGDVRNIAKTRGAQKVWRPRHFDPEVPWIYAWPFAEDGGTHADMICALADKLYQLGRGVDMAWAWGELLDHAALDAKLFEYNGIVLRPSKGDGLLLACPTKDSFKSLEIRYRALRFSYESDQRVFVQQPKSSYRQISYETSPVRHVFELRSLTDSGCRVAWPLEGASSLVVAAREAARARLSTALPNWIHEVDRHLVGRKLDGSNAVPADSRVRIVAIPSIGMHYADRAIRRLLIEIPAACPLRSEDVRWAFSGAELLNPDTGEVKEILLSPSNDDDMLKHYGVGTEARVFRSVTPVVLPDEGKRRRIEPTRKLAEAKPGLERVQEISAARIAVVQALRHAGVHPLAESIRLQREPFDRAGSRVEPFAEGTRFAKERLWHVEITFNHPVSGPLIIGDGRFLGLGLMAPVNIDPELQFFAIEGGLETGANPLHLAQALRRAVIARVQEKFGERKELPAFFTGHERNGDPLRSGTKGHLAFAVDLLRKNLWILPPHLLECRKWTSEEHLHLKTLDDALFSLRDLRAGASGRLRLSRRIVSMDTDPLLAPSRTWVSMTDYEPTRYAKKVFPKDVIVQDIHTEFLRRKMIAPEAIEILGIHEGPKGGLRAKVKLRFKTAVRGPILLGKTCHSGGGLFAPADE